MSTETSHTQAAQARIEEIRAMRQKIPNFVFPATKSERRRLTNAASVPPEFVEAATVAVKNAPVLSRAGAVDAEATRDLMAFADAYGPLADELDALAHFVRHSITAAKNKVGSDALTTYALTQRLAKRPETADLAPLADAMGRTLGRRRPKKASPATAPKAPAPQAPAPQTPPPQAPAPQTPKQP
jgi:hypothetical protein